MPYKILSLDGGASWAMVQARVLQDLYDETGDLRGHELLRKFDMVVANSGGSVLLGLLCNNMSLKKIISFYKTSSELKKVFPPLLLWERFFQHITRKLFHVGAKYSAVRKLKSLREIFISNDDLYQQNKLTTPIADTWLNELPSVIGKNYHGADVQFVISSFDYFRQRVVFFRSNVNSKTNSFSGNFYQITLAESIHASCNAPVNYYDRPALVNLASYKSNDPEDRYQSWYWDGAVAGFNNPVLAGVVEAITNNADVDLHNFKILSLGTGISRKAVVADDKSSSDPRRQRRFTVNRGKPFVQWKASFSFLKDIQKIAQSILSDPPDSATFIACSFINRSLQNDKNNLVRINPNIAPECRDDIYFYPMVYNTSDRQQKDFLKLMDLDFDVYKENDIQLIEDMCNKFIVTDEGSLYLQNQLIRGEPGSKHHLGYSSYREAKQRWQMIEREE